MKIYGICQTCSSEIHFWSFAETRVDLAMQQGENKELYCETCGTNNRIHLNDLYAKKSKFAEGAALLSVVIGLGLLWYYYIPIAKSLLLHAGGLVVAPISVYTIIKHQEKIRVNSFNHIQIKPRKTKNTGRKTSLNSFQNKHTQIVYSKSNLKNHEK